MNNPSHVYTVDTDTMREFEEYRRWWKQERADMARVEFCPQHEFGGCAGPECDRRCSATIAIPDASHTIRIMSAWTLLGWCVMAWILVGLAMSWGLNRQAAAIEISERV